MILNNFANLAKDTCQDLGKKCQNPKTSLARNQDAKHCDGCPV